MKVFLFAKDENIQYFFPELWPKVFSLQWPHKRFPRLEALEPATCAHAHNIRKWHSTQRIVTRQNLVSCPAVHAPRRRTSGGLAWISCHRHLSHLECEMSNQIAERPINSCYIIEVGAALIFVQSLQILCRKGVDQHSVLLRTELQQTYLKTSSGVCEFAWGKDVAGCLSSSLTTEIRKFAAPFTSDWSFDGRKHCWLLEGKAIQQIKQQIENRPDNCVLRQGAWTAGLETRHSCEQLYQPGWICI